MLLKYDFSDEQLGITKSAKVDVATHLRDLEKEFSDCDAIVLTSKDPFISEYVPLSNNPRYGATGFTGSVGDAVYWSEGFRAKLKAKGVEQKAVSLFVDGRYHLQADNETPSNLVEVVKIDCEPNIEGALRERIFAPEESKEELKIGVDFERTSIAVLQARQELAAERGSKLVNISGEKCLKALGLPGWKVKRPIYSLPESATGRKVSTTLQALTLDMNAVGQVDATTAATSGCALLITAATDDAAFLLNARGFHLPSTGSFLAYTFFTANELILFLPASSKECPVDIDPAQLGEFKLTVIRDDQTALRTALSKHKVSKIMFNGSTMNGLLPTFAKEIFPNAEFISNYNWVLRTRVKKTEAEMNSIRKAFLHSSRAISKTLRWGKSESIKRNVSEVELAKYLYQSYADEGAIALSFSTISGAGANSAIVHYSNPSSSAFFKKGELALLDSGAYYADGFPTDCTRGYFVGGKGTDLKPDAWQTDIYTTTLKSAIQVFMKPVDAKLSGRDVDALIRNEVKAAGYEYLHGTGHGVGIHVHEEGIRLSTLSIYPQSPYACVSVEPGIYIKDKGGVRVENIALLIPENNTHYRYENVVFVGYDWDLIDVSRLNDAERAYLKDYEAKCRALGTQLTDCPL